MKQILHNTLIDFIQWWFKDSTFSIASGSLSFNYIVRYSAGARRSDALPMLIALHGDGDTVENFYETALNEINVPARIILVKGPVAHQCGSVWPYTEAQFEKYEKAFSEIVYLLSVKYQTINKPVLLGYSGGGAMAYYQAVKRGDSYSCIFSISSLLPKEKLGGGLFNPSAKVYAYHGKSDAVISFSDGKKTIKLLKKNGVKIDFISFESGHQALYTDMKAKITHAIENKLTNLRFSTPPIE